MRRVPFTADEKTSLYVALDRHLDADLTPAGVDARMARFADTFPGPLRLGGPLLTVDTSQAVDVDALAAGIRTLVDH